MGAARRTFRGDVDGLRAVAIVLVVGYHALVPGFRGGFIGVDVFFVISGWLITRNLLHETTRTGSVALTRFWAKRIRRLIPALALMTVTVIVLTMFIVPSVDWSTVASQARAAALYVSNVVFARQATNYFGADVRTSLFLHTWSLGVEEQFYIVWPLLVAGGCLLARRRGPSRPTALRRNLLVLFSLTFVASLTECVMQTRAGSSSAFYLLPSRAWEFAAAGLLAVLGVPAWLTSRRAATAAAIAGIALLAMGTLGLSDATAYPGLWALIPVVAALLLITAGQGRPPVLQPSSSPEVVAGSALDANPVSVALSSAPAQWLGRVSYSWYLWHWPFILFAVELRHHDTTETRLVGALVSLGVAVVALNVVENRARFSSRLIGSRSRTYAMGAAVTAAVVAATFLFGAYATHVNARGLARELVVLRSAKLDRTCAHQISGPFALPYCEDGDLQAHRSVMLIGDSRAGMLQQVFIEAAKADHIHLYVRWIERCPVSPVVVGKVGAPGVVDQQCVSWRANNQTLIKQLHPDAVVVTQRDWIGQGLLADHYLSRPERDAIWRQGFASLLASLLADHVRIGRILSTPELPFDPVECMARAHSVGPCAVSRSAAYASSVDFMRAEQQAAEPVAGITSLDLSGAICPSGRCPMKIGSNYVWIDASHLNKPFTLSLEPEVAAFLRRLG